MTIDNIEKIRKDALSDIKEKIKKDSKYLHPCNKERLEDMKRLEFSSGYDFTCWMIQNGIMESPKRTMKYRNECARKAGFKDNAERQKIRRWTKGDRGPKEFNEDCASYFGDFTENLMIQTFEGAKRMPPNNPGFDWTCKRGDKIDNKGRCLCYSNQSNWTGWRFAIEYNNIADWFILSAWDNRESKKPLHVWLFHKNDLVRLGKGGCAPKVEFWRRQGITITNTQDGLEKFGEFEVTDRLYKLKELCNFE